MEKFSGTAHVSNEEVLSLVNEQRCLVHDIKQRQANWIGHVLRHDCLLKTVLEGKMGGKRTRGKPRRKMLDLLMEQEDKKIGYHAGVEEKSWIPDPVAPSSFEPALGQSTQEIFRHLFPCESPRRTIELYFCSLKLIWLNRAGMRWVSSCFIFYFTCDCN